MTARASLLLVDDEPRVLDAMRRCLRSRRAEWDVSFATGGAEAIGLLDARPFDFVVSDMRMPDVDGPALLGRVRDTRPGTARMVLSGQTDFDGAMRAVSLAHQFLGKPCRPDVLMTAVAGARDALAWIDEPLVRDALVALDALPSAPSTCRALRALLDDAEAPIDAVAAVVDADAGMSAKVLQVVASSFFGAGTPCADAAEAVRTLGAKVLAELARRAFDATLWPTGFSPPPRTEPLAARVGALVQALIDSSRPRDALGATLLRLWGVAAS